MFIGLELILFFLSFFILFPLAIMGLIYCLMNWALRKRGGRNVVASMISYPFAYLSVSSVLVWIGNKEGYSEIIGQPWFYLPGLMALPTGTLTVALVDFFCLFFDVHMSQEFGQILILVGGALQGSGIIWIFQKIKEKKMKKDGEKK